ncbi:MAG: VUT family protein [Lachnospiraceae bacterium]|nr:VUT family protein [Lachnospiraceae bacterium]
MNRLKSLFKEAVFLERSIPGVVSALFILSIVAMNLLANKSINLPFDWMALDCGIIFSWLVFLLMDMVTKHFGPRAATMLSVIALIVNLFMALMLFIGSIIPGMWGESFVESGGEIINNALDHTFRGTWYVLLGSSVAFIVSSVVNNEVNWLIGKATKKNPNFGAFALRSYVSTFIAQFVDNMVFALIVSHNFFGWTMTQCVVCALTGAVLELVCEVIFSPIGYRVAKRWQKNSVGQTYIDFIKEKGGRV